MRPVREKPRDQVVSAARESAAATRWSLLVGAIVTEVAATLALRASLDQSWWLVLVAVGYVAAFTCLTLVLDRGMPLGVAYGIWSASGVALTAVLAHLVFDDPLTGPMSLGIVAIGAGVLLVEVGSAKAGPR